MKKFASILCALTLMMSVNAAPFHSPKPVKSGGQQLEQRLQKAKTDKQRLELIRKYQSTQPVKTPAKRARRATTDVTITRVSMSYDGDSRSVFYGLHTDEFAPAFYFDIPVGETHDVEPGRTYQLEEMNADYCEWDDEDWNPHYYTEAAFTKTLGADYDIHIAAKVKDTDGNEWILHYDETPLVVTGDTVEVNIARSLNSCEYMLYSNEWLIRAQDNQWMVQLEYASADDQSPAGEFDASAINLSDTYIEFPTGGQDIYGEPEYKAVYAKDGLIKVQVAKSGRIDVNASLLCDDGNVYTVTLFYALPQKEGESTLTADNLNVDTWALDLWGELEAYASNEEEGWSFGLNLYPENPENYLTTYILGQYVSNNGYVSVDGEQFAIYSGEVTLAYTDNKYRITGTVLAWNNVEYSLQLSSPEPVTRPLTFAGEDLILDVFEGAWQIAGYDAAHENFLSLAVYADVVAGDYTETAFEPEYTYLALGEDIYLLSTADITVNYAEGIAGVSGSLHMVNQLDQYDHLDVTLDIQAHPYQPSVRTLNLVDFMFLYYEDGPDVYYQVMTEDSLRIFAFDILVERWSPDVVLGKTYSLNDMAESESQGIDIYENCYVNYETVQFKKAAVSNGNVTLTITVTDTRGNTWNLSYEGPDKEIEQAMTVELGQATPNIWDGGNGVEYEMVDKDNTLSCHLVFNLPGAADVIANIHYTSADIILTEFSYLSVFRHEYMITDASFCKEQEDGAVYITALVTDERGYKFNLRYYDGGFAPKGDTVQMTIEEPLSVTHWEEYHEWVLYAEDATSIVSISLDGDAGLNILGDVTEHVSVWSSHIEMLTDAATQSWDYIQLNSVESVVVSGEEGDYALEAIVIAETGVTYVISVNEKTEGVDVVKTDARAVKRLENGQMVIIQSNKKYTVLGNAIY